MKKCNTCTKSITNKAPGLVCSRCDVAVHVAASCSGLTTKQLTALRATHSLEWICQKCHEASPRRSSFIAPDDNEEEDNEIVADRQTGPQIDVKKLLEDINREVNKIVMRELQAVSNSAQYCSDKVDEFSEIIDGLTEKLKETEKKNLTIKNENTYLRTQFGALEQRMQQLEQNRLAKYIEVAGIPTVENESTEEIVKKVSTHLKRNYSEIKYCKRLPAKKGLSGPILIKISNENAKKLWITNGRNIPITVSTVIPEAEEKMAAQSVYVRDALTPFNKQLLRHAKEQLKNTNLFKFVWFKDGHVLARKAEKEKVHIIRSEKDIQDLTHS